MFALYQDNTYVGTRTCKKLYLKFTRVRQMHVHIYACGRMHVCWFMVPVNNVDYMILATLGTENF